MSGSELGILCFGVAGFFASGGLICAGLITRHRNAHTPSVETKRWGIVASALNLAQAAAGILLVITLAGRHADLDVLVFLSVATLLSAAVGVAGIIAAVRAKP